jgi:transcriptional regulator with XRE-family HTH domain
LHPIKHQRAKRRWSLRELGRRSGVPAGTISGIERGQREPHVLTLAKIADALEVDVEELINEAPKAPSRSSSAAPEEVPTEERLLSYIWSQKLQAEHMRKRWEEAAEENVFSYEAWSEAAEVAIELEEAFADAIPVEIYAAGDKWLPQEEWDTVAELYGNISLLKVALDQAFRAYQSRFGEKGTPADVKDFAAIREQREQREAAKRRTTHVDQRAG